MAENFPKSYNKDKNLNSFILHDKNWIRIPTSTPLNAFQKSKKPSFIRISTAYISKTNDDRTFLDTPSYSI